MDNEELTQGEAVDLDEIMRLIDMPAASEETVLAAQASESGQTNVQSEERIIVPKQKEKPISPQKSIVMYLHDLVFLMAGIVLVFLLCFRIVVVSGSSMYDTLVNGDYLLLLSNVFYTEAQPGDIIVASKETYDDGKPIVKRVIATEGQVVDIDFRQGIVYVDGVALEEDYIFSKTTTYEGVSFPLTVDEGCLFVLGDNRAKSKDSRNPEIGLIDRRQVVGKALLLIFPGKDEYDGLEFGRIGVIE